MSFLSPAGIPLPTYPAYLSPGGARWSRAAFGQTDRRGTVEKGARALSAELLALLTRRGREGRLRALSLPS